MNSGGFRNTSVAFEVQKQLSNVLNINLELDIVPMSKLLGDRKYGKGDLFRSGWIADYPSPENFLLLMYGKNVPADIDEPSFLNTPRYVSAAFDKLYEEGISATSIADSYEAFAKAEQQMMEEQQRMQQSLNAAMSPDLGSEVDITLAHKYDANTKIVFGVSHYWTSTTFSNLNDGAGSLANDGSDSNGNDDADWGFIMIDTKF